MYRPCPRRARPNLTAVAAAVLAGGAALAPVAAQAQSSQNYYYGIRQGLYMDDNIYMSPSNAKSDVYGTTTLLGGLSMPLGRQRLHMDGQVSRSYHTEATSLGSTGYNLRGGLDFETVERISGAVNAWAQRSRADFGGLGIDYQPVDNISTARGIDASIRKGVVTRLTLEGRMGYRTQRYSRSDYRSRDVDVWDGSVGIHYRPAGSLVLGAALRLTEGEYPTFTLLPDGRSQSEGFKGRNIDFSAVWPVTGASTVRAVVSVGKKEFDNWKSNDYSGVTGNLYWDWIYSGRTQLQFGLSRDTGTEPYVQIPIGDEVPIGASGTLVRDILSARMTYALTGKTTLSARAEYLSATMPGRRALLGRERLYKLGVGVRWQATRVVAAGCDIDRKQRLAPSDYTYTSNRFGCWAEAVFR